MHSGFVQRDIQELPPPGGGEPGPRAPVHRILRVPEGRQGGPGARGVSGPRARPTRIPGLHVGRARGLHAEPPPCGPENPPMLRPPSPIHPRLISLINYIVPFLLMD